MFTRVTILSALALPLLIAAAPAGAATKSRTASNSQANAAAIEARQKCFMEAQAQVPADGSNTTGTMSKRTALYTACAQRSGVRP